MRLRDLMTIGPGGRQTGTQSKRSRWVVRTPTTYLILALDRGNVSVSYEQICNLYYSKILR